MIKCSLNGHTLCLIKVIVIVVQTFVKSGRTMSTIISGPAVAMKKFS